MISYITSLIRPQIRRKTQTTEGESLRQSFEANNKHKQVNPQCPFLPQIPKPLSSPHKGKHYKEEAFLQPPKKEIQEKTKSQTQMLHVGNIFPSFPLFMWQVNHPYTRRVFWQP